MHWNIQTGNGGKSALHKTLYIYSPHYTLIHVRYKENNINKARRWYSCMIKGGTKVKWGLQNVKDNGPICFKGRRLVQTANLCTSNLPIVELVIRKFKHVAWGGEYYSPAICIFTNIIELWSQSKRKHTFEISPTIFNLISARNWNN